DRKLHGNHRMSRHKQRSLSHRSDELETEAHRVVEAKAVPLDRALEPRRGQAQRPEFERLIGAHAKTDAVDHTRARAAPSQAWILEEGEVGAGASFLVGVEEVVDGGVVLVDRFLDQAHAHDAGIEEQVLRGVGRDRAYVVDAVQVSCLSSFLPGRDRDNSGSCLFEWWGSTATTRSGTARRGSTSRK